MKHETGWFKSSYSAAASDNCVEARIDVTAVRLRDSVHAHDTILTVDSSAWQAFLAALHNDHV